jgi:deazaflavin-dependent oxidoreductase (nitroreductase family)
MDKSELGKAAGRTWPIPTDMTRFMRELIAEYRATAGRLSGELAGRNFILLTTTGARSGRPRTTAVAYVAQGKRLLVIASANGAPSNPAWFRNLLADPRAIVELGAEKFEVRARTASHEERGKLAQAIWYLDGQQRLTDREIPIVILERIDRKGGGGRRSNTTLTW